MARYSIAAILGCLYIAVSAWIVQREGAAYRETLRASKTVSGMEVARSPAGPDSGRKAEPDPPRRVEEPERAGPAPDPEPPHKKKAQEKARPHPDALASKGPEVPRHQTPKPAKHEGEAHKDAPAPDPWRDLSLSHLTPEDERRLGLELHQLILSYNTPLNSGPYLQRVVEVARPLLASRSRKEIDYQFTVLNTEAVNAFSHPGGYIYVSRGLFDLIGEDEDYALEFILAHEIAHVDLKHALKCLADAGSAGRKGVLPTLPKFYLLIAFGYQDEQEFEADAWAYRCLKRLDRTRRECLAFLRKFEGYARTHGFENGHQLSPEKSNAPAIENHFRAHPAAWDRLGRLSALSASTTTSPASGPPR